MASFEFGTSVAQIACDAAVISTTKKLPAERLGVQGGAGQRRGLFIFVSDSDGRALRHIGHIVANAAGSHECSALAAGEMSSRLATI
eukprot:6172953-Pleurochrysis_carterae.AAC.2